MNKIKKLVSVFFLVFLIISNVACSKDKQNNLVESESQAKPIKIGLISILSGDYVFFGDNYRKGAELAKEIYNKKNPNRSVEIIVEDDGFDAKKGISAFKKLTEVDKIDALINASSPTVNAIYDSVLKMNMPVIQAGEQGQDPVNDSIFQIMPGNIAMEEALGKYVRKQDFEKVAFIYSSVGTWVRFADHFKIGYGKELDEYRLEANERDFSTMVLKINKNDYDIIVFIIPPEQGALLLKEMRGLMKNKPQFISDFSFDINEYKRILGDMEYLEDTIVMTLKKTTSEEFAKVYKEKYDEEPGIAADFGYDAFDLLVSTYDANKDKWLKNIKEADCEGVSGLIKFDKVGVRAPQWEIKRIKKGELQ